MLPRIRVMYATALVTALTPCLAAASDATKPRLVMS